MRSLISPALKAFGMMVPNDTSASGCSSKLRQLAAELPLLYLAARGWSGRLTANSRATLDNSALIWHYTTLQGIVAALVVHIVPLLMD